MVKKKMPGTCMANRKQSRYCLKQLETMFTFRGCVNRAAPLVVLRWFEITHTLYPAINMSLLCSLGISSAFSGT